ncbi:MAG: MFS transporter [Galactobacter sp.]
MTTTSAHPTPKQGTTYQGILLLFAACMSVLAATIITPILPQLSAQFSDAPDAVIQMIVVIPALLVALCSPFAGQIVDRIGRKWLGIICLFVYAVAGTVPAWAESLGVILASRVVVGLSEAAVITVSTTLIVDYFDGRRRDRFLGLQTVATSLSAVVFIAIGGALGAHSWHTPFFVYFIGAVLAVLMIFALWEPGRDSQSHRDVAAGAKEKLHFGPLVAPLLVTLFGGFTFYILIIEMSYLVVENGVAANDTAKIGMFSAIAAVATAAGGLSFPTIAKIRLGVRVPMIFAFQGVGFILLWVLPGLPGLMIGSIVACFASGFLLPTMLTWVVAKVKFALRGRVTGLWNFSFFFGQFATALIMGGISGAIGDLHASVGVVGIAALVVAVVTAVWLRKDSGPAEHNPNEGADGTAGFGGMTPPTAAVPEVKA